MKSRSSTKAAPTMQHAKDALLGHIEALHAHLEDAADEAQALEVALILLDLYERLLEMHEVLIIDRGEARH